MIALAPKPHWVDVADLRVQERMAGLAEQVLYLTWAQAVIGVIGAIALIVTLRESRRATATALKAVNVQQTAERAVLVIEKPTLEWTPLNASGTRAQLYGKKDRAKFSVAGRVTYTNRGKSLALVLEIRNRLLFSDLLPPKPTYTVDGRARQHRPLKVDEELKGMAPRVEVSLEDEQRVRAGELRAWLFGQVTYKDLFGDKHTLRYCYRLRPGHPSEEDGGAAYWENT
jgi:hypothetical protein